MWPNSAIETAFAACPQSAHVSLVPSATIFALSASSSMHSEQTKSSRSYVLFAIRSPWNGRHGGPPTSREPSSTKSPVVVGGHEVRGLLHSLCWSGIRINPAEIPGQLVDDATADHDPRASNRRPRQSKLIRA